MVYVTHPCIEFLIFFEFILIGSDGVYPTPETSIKSSFKFGMKRVANIRASYNFGKKYYIWNIAWVKELDVIEHIEGARIR